MEHKVISQAQRSTKELSVQVADQIIYNKIKVNFEYYITYYLFYSSVTLKFTILRINGTCEMGQYLR